MKKVRNRVLQLPNLLDKKSFFLFGPRATGKSTLIRTQLTNTDSTVMIDLLSMRLYREFLSKPWQLEDFVRSQTKSESPIVVIDEIQKVPELLNEVHRLIEAHSWKFLLTGSSARSLKAKGVNLLAGRAWTAELFPLCMPEIHSFDHSSFDLAKRLQFGSLPAVYDSLNQNEELEAYVATYLKEEISSEGLSRNLAVFSDFLKVAGLSQTKVLNLNKLAKNLGISQPTVRSYFQILEDTFIGTMLQPWNFSTKRKSISHAKFYIFDLGVAHAMSGTQSLDRNSSLFGDAFECFLISEVRSYLSYRRIKETMFFWRTTTDDEVDLVVGKKAAFEFKSTDKVQASDLEGLKKLHEEQQIPKLYMVSQDQFETTSGNIRILHWRTFLKELWHTGSESTIL